MPWPTELSEHVFMRKAREIQAERRCTKTQSLEIAAGQHPDLHADFVALSRSAGMAAQTYARPKSK